MKERKQFAKEVKEGAARLVTEQGRTIADVAKSLGVSPWTLSRWVKAARSEGAGAFRGHGQRTPLEQLVERAQIFDKTQAVLVAHIYNSDAENVSSLIL